MVKDEPTASLRVLSATLYDAANSPLPSGTSWSAGMTKLSKANGAFANTTNTPTPVTGGADNAFKLQLTAAEVDTLGPLRVQFFDAPGGQLIAEYVDEVVSGSTATLTLHSGTAQAGAANSITLASGASAVNGTYVDATVYIDGGTGAGQLNTITAYTGSSKLAAVAKTWAVNPDATSTYKLLPSATPLAAAIATLNGVNVEGTLKLSDSIRLQNAVLAGKASNFEANSASFRSLDDSKTRVTLTVDSTGRPVATIGDLT